MSEGMNHEGLHLLVIGENPEPALPESNAIPSQPGCAGAAGREA